MGDKDVPGGPRGWDSRRIWRPNAPLGPRHRHISLSKPASGVATPTAAAARGCRFANRWLAKVATVRAGGLTRWRGTGTRMRRRMAFSRATILQKFSKPLGGAFAT